jgi:UDP-N-acetyl-D-mannosaminuronate dehydrogenase
MFLPRYIVIHSTVKPGTTRKIDSDAIYSPVNGRHADGLVQTVQSYPKLFAGDEDAYQGIDSFYSLRCVHVTTNRDELEYAKVLCTTYTGLNVAYEKLLTKDCDKRGYNREIVYTMWNRMYNDGIAETHPEWKRPIYTHMPGKIGGHCVIPNLELVKNEVTDAVKRLNKNLR